MANGNVGIEPDQKNKADAGKSNPLLLEVGCAKALEVLTRVLDYGYEKYVDPKNPPPLDKPTWRKVDPRQYDAAARRHRRDRDKGQTHDLESGLIHLAHEGINILFQIEKMIENNPGMEFLRYNPPPRIWMGEKVRGEGPKLKGLDDYAFEDKDRTNFGPSEMPQRTPPAGHGAYRGDGVR